ncbi:glycoside hydrolase family 104 protein [Burkholderia pseudomallei]|uniref:glycoside hydrolase family 24 protein n=1 Tax=Burkholderia pseudomallei TaxID=28450 RepID=UPI0018C743EE|nr:glycoside hydrolase family 104 protein [Burkholderia pseudomallei]MBG1252212.1 glycoside hydrolase family 104 protein [Burkholderia pseudomallei]
MARAPVDQLGGPNIAAFLDTIAVSEGTAGQGDDGYNVLVGGGLFTSYAQHPNLLVTLRPGLRSTAAGRYQFLFSTWTGLRAALGLPDFSPVSQDLACVELLKQVGAYDLIVAGDVTDAIARCNRTWASFPGSPYGQGTRPQASLLAAYASAGGTMEA